jgi:hypothetical protein
MSFQRSEMQYDSGYYKWRALADHDNPYYTKGADYSELNRTEGYEVLYFINHIANKHWKDPVNRATYQSIERMIRYDVPSNIRTHSQMEKWIIANW